MAEMIFSIKHHPFPLREIPDCPGNSILQAGAEDIKTRFLDRKEGSQMAKDFGLTDEQVEQEIERLTKSPFVALARYEQRVRYRRRQYLYTLRDLEKKGKALEKSGITREMLAEMAGEYCGED